MIISFSLKKNQIKEFGYLQGIVPGYNTSNKIKFNTTYKLNTINNYSKKSSINLSSLPNLLCNNYMNMQSQTVIKNNIININEQNKKILKDKKNKNKNISEKKNLINECIKFNYVNNHQNKDNYNNYNRKKGGNNETNYNINEKLKNIHFGIKSLLDNLYKIYYINKDIVNKWMSSYKNFIAIHSNFIMLEKIADEISYILYPMSVDDLIEFKSNDRVYKRLKENYETQY